MRRSILPLEALKVWRFYHHHFLKVHVFDAMAYAAYAETGLFIATKWHPIHKKCRVIVHH